MRHASRAHPTGPLARADRAIGSASLPLFGDQAVVVTRRQEVARSDHPIRWGRPMEHRDGLYSALVQRGVSRRAFLKFSAAMSAALALPGSYAPRIAAAIATAPRIPVIWLEG